MLNANFYKVFGKIPILGMIHLAGDKPVKRALEEIEIFEKYGVDGAIVENYHGSVDDVATTLEEVSKINTKVIIGANVLPNEFQVSIPLAASHGAKFVQLDHVAGKYTFGEIDSDHYLRCKRQFREIVVLGGVWPKYYRPVFNSNLEKDIETGIGRAEAIVVTGEGTGQNTPFYKIKNFREIMGKHPLIIGAGLTAETAYSQLDVADGAIVGTFFKPKGDTSKKIDEKKVKDFIDVVQSIRKGKYG